MPSGIADSGRQLPTRRRRVGPAQHLVARLQPVGGQDVPLLAVGVVQQGDPGAAVRIVLDRVDHGGDAVLVAAEVDQAVLPLVAAAAMPGGDLALVVPPALAPLRRAAGSSPAWRRASTRRSRSRSPRGGPAWSDCIGECPWFSLLSYRRSQLRCCLEEVDPVFRVQRDDGLFPGLGVPLAEAASGAACPCGSACSRAPPSRRTSPPPPGGRRPCRPAGSPRRRRRCCALALCIPFSVTSGRRMIWCGSRRICC